MSLLLDFCYLLGLLLASPWLAFRLTRSRGWHRVPRRFGFRLGAPLEDAVWLHGSSVGEISLLKPLVARLAASYPELPLLITSYTPTGVAAAEQAYPGHRVLPFPLDLSFVVERFLTRFRPRLIVVVESDFWPNHLARAESRGIPVAVVNAKLSAKSFAMHRRTRLIPRRLRQAALVAAQTEEHARRFVALGVPAAVVRVTGNMKYDLAAAPAAADARAATRARLGFAADDIVVVGGSLHEGEDAALLESFRALAAKHAGTALVIVPRYPDQAAAVVQAAAAAGYAAVRKTAVDRGEAAAPGSRGVLVVDTLGELGGLYAAADIAFVGGSLYYRGANKGGHNLMEPAILGLPVLFGPYNFSFKETVADLLAGRAGLLVHDAGELAAALERLVSSPTERAAIGARAREVVLHGQGATARNLDLLRPMLAGGATLQPYLNPSTMPPAPTDSDTR